MYAAPKCFQVPTLEETKLRFCQVPPKRWKKKQGKPETESHFEHLWNWQPQKINLAIFFLIFLSFYLRSSSWLRIVLPVLLEQSCNELMAITVPRPCSQWISGFPKQYESSNHPQTKLIYSQKYQEPGFLWIVSTTNLSLEDIWALIPERFPMRVDEIFCHPSRPISTPSSKRSGSLTQWNIRHA